MGAGKSVSELPAGFEVEQSDSSLPPGFEVEAPTSPKDASYSDVPTRFQLPLKALSMGERGLKAAGGLVAPAIEKVDEYTGAPIRKGISSFLGGETIGSALEDAGNQFGKPGAPSFSHMLPEAMGKTSPSQVAPEYFGQGKLQPGGIFDQTPKQALGGLLDAGTNPATYLAPKIPGLLGKALSGAVPSEAASTIRGLLYEALPQNIKTATSMAQKVGPQLAGDHLPSNIFPEGAAGEGSFPGTPQPPEAPRNFVSARAEPQEGPKPQGLGLMDDERLSRRPVGVDFSKSEGPSSAPQKKKTGSNRGKDPFFGKKK